MSNTITAAQNSANLKTASKNAVESLFNSGVLFPVPGGKTMAETDPRDFTYEQRIAYNKALALEILRYPNSFTDGTLSSAHYVADKTYQELADTSFDWGMFESEVVNNAANLATFSGKSILVGIALLAAVIGFMEYSKRAA